MVSLDGGWEQHLFLAEGRCEGTISGRFRGANFPRRHGSHGPFRPDFRAVIETDDEALVMFEWHGYGRAYPPGAARSSVRSFTPATPLSTTDSTMRCASASAKSARWSTLRSRNPTSSSTSPS